jgi:hypothetical protein
LPQTGETFPGADETFMVTFGTFPGEDETFLAAGESIRRVAGIFSRTD